ncbi:MAG: preprotein translocase subunit SecE [bacterium]
MNGKTEAEGSALDTLKLLVAVVIIAAGIVGFYYYEEQVLWMRLLGLLVVVGIALFIAGQTAKGRLIRGFLSDAHVEMRKVVWPTRQETVQTTLVIAVAVLITALFLWGVDSLLFVIVKSLTGA